MKEVETINVVKTYVFGQREHSREITAESFEDAMDEFMLSCIDFSAFSYKHSEHTRSIHKEPLGYQNGMRNPSEYIYPFYQLIPVYEDGNKIYEISITEFNNWHLRQTNILENKDAEVESLEHAPQDSMTYLGKDIVSTSLQLRNMKMQMSLQLMSKTNEMDEKLSETQNQLSLIEDEYKTLNQKMSILKTYAGVGRDIVQIRAGKPSEQLKVDVFQAFKYMKEDIEILSDYKDFDANCLDDFDKFVYNNYEKLLPSEKSIQAYKVSKHDIRYDDLVKTYEMREYNRLVYLLIRDGENVYRLFNNYDLHDDKLFSFGEPKEEADKVMKELLKDSFTHSWRVADKLIDSYNAKVSKTVSKGYTIDYHGDMDRMICEIPFDKDEKQIASLKKKAEAEYEVEIFRRRSYIETYGLQEELDIHSWRWGQSLGDYYFDLMRYPNHVQKVMDFIEAHDTKNYLKIHALVKSSMSTYLNLQTKINKPLLMEPDREKGWAVTSYNTYRNSRNEDDFSSNFDPLTATPLVYYALWCDYDKYIEHFLAKSKKAMEEALKSYNIKNFNSLAILQNILDSKRMFESLPKIDVIANINTELLNFIKDGSHLLEHTSEILNPFLEDTSRLSKGDKVYVIRKEVETVELNHYCKVIDLVYAKVPQVILATVVSNREGTLKLKGHFSVYLNNSRTNGTGVGDAKIATRELQRDWKLVAHKGLEESTIIKLLNNRAFREENFEDKASMLKELLNVIRRGVEFNYPGGTRHG